MSKKRASRNSKKVLKSLQNKRRAKYFAGGGGYSLPGFPSDQPPKKQPPSKKPPPPDISLPEWGAPQQPEKGQPVRRDGGPWAWRSKLSPEQMQAAAERLQIARAEKGQPVSKLPIGDTGPTTSFVGGAGGDPDTEDPGDAGPGGWTPEGEYGFGDVDNVDLGGGFFSDMMGRVRDAAGTVVGFLSDAGEIVFDAASGLVEGVGDTVLGTQPGPGPDQIEVVDSIPVGDVTAETSVPVGNITAGDVVDSTWTFEHVVGDTSAPAFDMYGGQWSSGDGRISQGTRVFDRYDASTDTFYGNQGGTAGMIPISVSGSAVSPEFKDAWNSSQASLSQQSDGEKGFSPTPFPGDDSMYAAVMPPGENTIWAYMPGGGRVPVPADYFSSTTGEYVQSENPFKQAEEREYGPGFPGGQEGDAGPPATIPTTPGTIPTTPSGVATLDESGNTISDLGPDGDVAQLDPRTQTTVPEGVQVGEIDPATGEVARGPNLSWMPRFKDPSKYYADEAARLRDTTAAEGEVSREVEAGAAMLTPTEAAARDAAQEEEARARESEFIISDDAFTPEVSYRDGVTISPTPEAERQLREIITGTEAPDGIAQLITDSVGYEAAQRRIIRGEAATGAAAGMLAETSGLPPEITAAIVENPAIVEAKIDSEPVEVIAAVAALPTEALVSAQMEGLLAGMDEGQVPLWARPAVSFAEQRMAQRGLSVSSVGRDALFNSIIQSALPMAQSNAEALQTRAAQNLNNQQQANLETSRLDMQRRMANLANRQTSESQSASNAQNMAVMQSQFRQQAVLQGAGSDQQVFMQNLQNRQQAAVIGSQNQQQINAQELGNAQQIELAELQIESETEGANQSAINQERLSEMNIAAEYLAKNAGFKQQMELANLSNDQQMRLANLSAKNQAASEQLSADEQTELANLNTRMQTNLLQGKIASDMGIAQLSVDQQRALANASMVANIDLTKFSDAQQVELVNSNFMKTMTMRDFDATQQAIIQDATALASMDMQEADLFTKSSIENARNFLQMDLSNLNNNQQGIILDQQFRQQRIISNQAAENAARQFNATNRQQMTQFHANLFQNMKQFNASQINAMEQFNASETNRVGALNAQNYLDASKFNNELVSRLSMFDQELQFRTDSWNASNWQAVEQSNIQWRRKANTLDTAAQNAANMAALQFAFNMSAGEQNFLWQTMRDQAAFNQASQQGQKERAMQILSSIYGNTDMMRNSKTREFASDIAEQLEMWIFGKVVGAMPAYEDGTDDANDDSDYS